MSLLVGKMMLLLTLNVLAATITQPKTKAPVRDRRYKLSTLDYKLFL